jgi:hypothetical protein
MTVMTFRRVKEMTRMNKGCRREGGGITSSSIVIKKRRKSVKS